MKSHKKGGNGYTCADNTFTIKIKIKKKGQISQHVFGVSE